MRARARERDLTQNGLHFLSRRNSAHSVGPIEFPARPSLRFRELRPVASSYLIFFESAVCLPTLFAFWHRLRRVHFSGRISCVANIFGVNRFVYNSISCVEILPGNLADNMLRIASRSLSKCLKKDIISYVYKQIKKMDSFYLEKCDI